MPLFTQTLLCILPMLLSGAGAGSAAWVHDLHESHCLIEYFPGSGRLQISLDLFLDDLEEGMVREGVSGLGLCTLRERPDAEAQLLSYLQRAFILHADGEQLRYELVNKELAGDLMTMSCFMEVTGMNEIGVLRVSNSILLHVFEDQKNIVRIFGPEGKIKTLWFERGKTEDFVAF